MTDILAIIQNGNGNIKLEVTGEDLLLFSNQLISRAKHELSTAIAEARKEKYLTKEEVKKMCGVCDTTLWHWSKKLSEACKGWKQGQIPTIRHSENFR